MSTRPGAGSRSPQAPELRSSCDEWFVACVFTVSAFDLFPLMAAPWLLFSWLRRGRWRWLACGSSLSFRSARSSARRASFYASPLSPVPGIACCIWPLLRFFIREDSTFLLHFLSAIRGHVVAQAVFVKVQFRRERPGEQPLKVGIEVHPDRFVIALVIGEQQPGFFVRPRDGRRLFRQFFLGQGGDGSRSESVPLRQGADGRFPAVIVFHRIHRERRGKDDHVPGGDVLVQEGDGRAVVLFDRGPSANRLPGEAAEHAR